MGSASETEYQVLLAHDLEYINQKTHTELTNDVWEVKRMLVSYAQYVCRGETPKAARSRSPNARRQSPKTELP